MFVDEENKYIEWEGMPRSLMMNIENDFDLVISDPLQMINLLL